MSEHIKELLLVEDDNDHAEIAEFCIQEYNNNINVRRISDGEEALKFFDHLDKSENPLPWLVLLDLKLPKHDGFEVLSKIKSSARLTNIPVVVFSTSNSIRDIGKALSNNANSYIVKPVKPDGYSEIIVKILDYWSINQHQRLQNN